MVYTISYMLPCNLACQNFDTPSLLLFQQFNWGACKIQSNPAQRQTGLAKPNQWNFSLYNPHQTNSPKISEAMLLDLSNSKSACFQHSFIQPKPNVLKRSCRIDSWSSINPKYGTLFISSRLLPLGIPSGRLLIISSKSFPRRYSSFMEDVHLVPLLSGWEPLSNASQAAPSILLRTCGLLSSLSGVKGGQHCSVRWTGCEGMGWGTNYFSSLIFNFNSIYIIGS